MVFSALPSCLSPSRRGPHPLVYGHSCFGEDRRSCQVLVLFAVLLKVRRSAGVRGGVLGGMGVALRSMPTWVGRARSTIEGQVTKPLAQRFCVLSSAHALSGQCLNAPACYDSSDFVAQCHLQVGAGAATLGVGAMVSGGGGVDIVVWALDVSSRHEVRRLALLGSDR